MLFALIGAAVGVEDLSAEVLAGSFAALGAGLAVRFVVALGSVWGGPALGWAECLFIAVAWLPKATVQAALGPVALDAVAAALPSSASGAERSPAHDQALEAGRSLLALAVLSILVTAPAGAALIAWAGPRLLRKDEPAATERLTTPDESAGRPAEEAGGKRARREDAHEV
jgi:NhaP-type Na+/H+ or K+/H+ antiporter